MTAVEQPEWVPLMEGVRMLARAASEKSGDSFTRQDLSSAAGLLERAGREGRIRAEGLRYLDHQASPLTAEDWMKLQIHESNKLDDPQRDLRAFRVRITNVVVDARDVRSLGGEPGADRTSIPATPSASLSIKRVGRPKTAVAELMNILPELYPEGDPVPAGKSVEEVRKACEKRMRKSVSPSSVNRARKSVWGNQNSSDII